MRTWESTLVQLDSTIKEVIQAIDASGMQIALIVDEQRILHGTVTDGDVRRGFLKGKTLEDSTTEIMNPNPLTVQQHEDNKHILRIMRQRKLHQIPIVDEKGIVVGLESIDELLEPEAKDNWVVLMAGGLGTRLYPLTEDCPKPLLKVGNKPILETIMENFMSYGLRKFYISVNYKAEMIEDYFGDGSKWNVEIRYLREDKRLGTAGALSLIPEKSESPVIVMNGDLLTKVNFSQLLQFHSEQKAIATLCVRDYEYQVPYGVVRVDENKLQAIVEKPVERYFVNAGIYVLNPELLNEVPADRFYDMPTLFETLIQSRRNAAVFPIREYWMDIGRMDDFERAKSEYMEVFL